MREYLFKKRLESDIFYITLKAKKKKKRIMLFLREVAMSHEFYNLVRHSFHAKMTQTSNMQIFRKIEEFGVSFPADVQYSIYDDRNELGC